MPVEALGDLRVFGSCMDRARTCVAVSSSISFPCSRRSCENRHALGEDGAAGERQPILRQVAALMPFGTADGAVVERFHAGQNLQQRGFAGAVGADDADAVVGRDQPVGSFEEEFVAVALAGAGELNHSFNRLMREAI